VKSKEFDNQRRQKLQEERLQAQKTPPWFAEDDKVMEDLKARILKLSKDESNFTMDAPDDSVFEFTIKSFASHAKTALEEDAELRKLRFKLVPKKVQEDAFWRNYFYRVSLLREQNSLSPLPLSPSSTVEPSPKSQGANGLSLPVAGGEDGKLKPSPNLAAASEVPDVNSLSEEMKAQMRKELGLGSPKSDAEKEKDEIDMNQLNDMLAEVPEDDENLDEDIDVEKMLAEEETPSPEKAQASGETEKDCANADLP